MKYTTAACVLLAAEAATGQRVMKTDFVKRLVPSAPRSLTRRATVTEALGNAAYLYYANVTAGTPAQSVMLQIDTGSSDVWMSATNATYCTGRNGAENCVGGTFNSATSSTFKYVNDLFNITYVDMTGSVGDYFTDVLRIGGVTVTGQQMGLAIDTTIGTGILGIGYPSDEAICKPSGCPGQYPTMVQNMVSQKLINTQAYSLWLDDLQASTGSVLFGGVDTAKYMGSLATLPVQPDTYAQGLIDSFTVAWTGFSIGGCSTFASSSFAEPAILDSGTTLTLVPDDLFSSIATELGVQYVSNYQAYVLPCNLAGYAATLNYQFGGSSGPTIKVPVSEVILPLILENGSTPKFSNGQTMCQFGIEPAGEDPILLGDTFLRSAYVVYDLANNQISIAQTDFNATTSNVQEIVAGANGVPNVASTATAVSASATVSGPVRTVASSSHTASASAALSNSSPLACVGTNTVGGAVIATGTATKASGTVTTTKASGTATATATVAGTATAASAAAATSHAGAAAGLRAPVAGFEASVVSMLPIALVMGSALIGSGLFLL